MADGTKEDFHELISAKATELFDLCDKEKKGFIIKRDIQRLRDEFGVEPEQLEDVFESLDVNHNGYLTLDEFIGENSNVFLLFFSFDFRFQRVSEIFSAIK